MALVKHTNGIKEKNYHN